MSHVHAQLSRLTALVSLALALAGLLVVAPAASAAGAPAPGLTAHQERVVLDLIDDVCGDTWCEGDYAFDFRRFDCVAAERTCTLRLRIASRAQEPLQWHWRAGQVKGFTRFHQMVDTSASGYRSLDPDFYSAVSRLIDRVEASVPTGGS